LKLDAGDLIALCEVGEPAGVVAGPGTATTLPPLQPVQPVDGVSTTATLGPAVPLASIDRPVPPRPAVRPRRPIDIALVLNGNVQYSEEIARGFTDRLERLLDDTHRCPRFEVARIDPWTGAPHGDAMRELLDRFASGAPEYMVSIGTQPTLAAAPFARRMCLPLIFAGVTDPVAAGIVKTLDADACRGRIAGVTYGLSVEYRLRFLALAFPGKRIGFLWSQDHPQDVTFRDEIATLCRHGLFDARQFPLLELNGLQITPEIEASADLFFGHFHLNANFRALSRSTQKPIVGVNTGDVRRDAAASLGNDDRALGETAAEQVLFRHLQFGVALCDIPIIVPNSARFGVNLAVLRKKGLSIDPAGLAMASEIIDW
jgi:putative ABC transport system substrate-binding protein